MSIVCSALRKISATDENLDVESIANMLQTTLNVKTGDRSPNNAISPDNSDTSQHSVVENGEQNQN